MSIWKHGKYADMWSLVHFLSGFLLAGLFYLLGSSLAAALAFSLIIMILWEVFEFSVKIIEPFTNIASDIFFGLAGFTLSTYLYSIKDLPFDTPLHIMILVVNLILGLWGFIDFLKRGYR